MSGGAALPPGRQAPEAGGRKADKADNADDAEKADNAAKANDAEKAEDAGEARDPQGRGTPGPEGPASANQAGAAAAAGRREQRVRAPDDPARGDEADAALLGQRDATLEDVERLLARRLKRVLADEQNEVLDLLRRSMPATLDDLVPDTEAHAAQYADAALSQLDAAAAQGAAAVGGGRDAEGHPAAGSCRELSVQLGEALVRPLRERISRSLDESGGDLDEVTGRLRALYREWKSQRIGDTVRHYAVAAYAAGAFDAAPSEAELRWLPDRGGEPCPDADDNALAAGVRKGEPFPTGDRCAPAHPGCRCLVVPVPPPPAPGG